MNRVVKGLNRERQKEGIRLSLPDLNARIRELQAKVEGAHREAELLETVDVNVSVLDDLDKFKELMAEQADAITYWQEQVFKIEKLIRY